MTEKARLFMNGGSQAVRLPKDCRFTGTEVLVNRIGNAVILVPADDPWGTMIEGLKLFTEDFMAEEDDLPVQERDAL